MNGNPNNSDEKGTPVTADGDGTAAASELEVIAHSDDKGTPITSGGERNPLDGGTPVTAGGDD